MSVFIRRRLKLRRIDLWYADDFELEEDDMPEIGVDFEVSLEDIYNVNVASERTILGVTGYNPLVVTLDLRVIPNLDQTAASAGGNTLLLYSRDSLATSIEVAINGLNSLKGGIYLPGRYDRITGQGSVTPVLLRQLDYALYRDMMYKNEFILISGERTNREITAANSPRIISGGAGDSGDPGLTTVRNQSDERWVVDTIRSMGGVLPTDVDTVRYLQMYRRKWSTSNGQLLWRFQLVLVKYQDLAAGKAADGVSIAAFSQGGLNALWMDQNEWFACLDPRGGGASGSVRRENTLVDPRTQFVSSSEKLNTDLSEVMTSIAVYT